MAIESLILKLRTRDDLSAVEEAALASAISREEVFQPGQIIVPEDVTQTQSMLLVAGMAARSKLLPDGGRQITELHVPGDFIDLHSFLLKKLEHDVVALTVVRMGVAPHERLKQITETLPHLTRMLWLSTLMDAAIHRQWIVSSGRRTATEQVAHLFCELMVRFRVVRMADGDRCPLPLTQQQLADACGISAVHVNRVLQDLRRDGMIEIGRGRLVIRDFERLARLAGFNPDYLMLDRIPR